MAMLGRVKHRQGFVMWSVVMARYCQVVCGGLMHGIALVGLGKVWSNGLAGFRGVVQSGGQAKLGAVR